MNSDIFVQAARSRPITKHVIAYFLFVAVVGFLQGLAGAAWAAVLTLPILLWAYFRQVRRLRQAARA
jgi:uncharacterized membrane protein YfcA